MNRLRVVILWLFFWGRDGVIAPSFYSAVCHLTSWLVFLEINSPVGESLFTSIFQIALYAILTWLADIPRMKGFG